MASVKVMKAIINDSPGACTLERAIWYQNDGHSPTLMLNNIDSSD